MGFRGRVWFSSTLILLVVLFQTGGFPAVARSAPAGARPEGYITGVAAWPGPGPWSFIALGDTRGVGGSAEQKLWARYLAAGRRCPPGVGYCPAWRRLVYARVAELLNHGRAALAVHTGDLLLCGYCPPDWDLFRKIFWSRLKNKRRFWPAIGNHETPFLAKDRATLTPARPCLKGFHQVFPFLKTPDGVCRHNYWTTYRNAAFVFLCTGGRQKGGPRGGYVCPVASSDVQAAWLRRVAAWAAARKGLNHVFVTWHVPPFTCSDDRVSGPARQYGQTVLDLARRYPGLRFTVFNGHEHVTEMFRIQKVLFLVAGAGGAPQRRHTRTCRCDRRLAAHLVGPALYRWCFLRKTRPVRPVTVNFFTVKVDGRRLWFQEHRLKDPQRPELGFRLISWGRLPSGATEHHNP
jgi:3',5'-cyclic AMP phosphodiesterase CpdA